jgi:hypothetical protein|tara:strand:+ start:93 stop:440 length:348 start_codon:yes stop_codon:yes gene_type:complete
MSSKKLSEQRDYLVYFDPESNKYGYSSEKFYWGYSNSLNSFDLIDMKEFDLTKEEAKNLCSHLNNDYKRKKDPLNFLNANQISKSLIPRTTHISIPHKKINNLQIPITHHHQNSL